MRAQRLWSEVIEWRWAPTVAIAFGALFFVTLSIVVIPDKFGEAIGNPHLNGTSLNSSAMFGATATQPGQTETSEREGRTSNLQGAIHGSSPQQQGMSGGFPRRGFSPPLPRAEPEIPQPAPPPAEVMIPPPAPPPPADMNEAPPPAPPVEVQPPGTQAGTPDSAPPAPTMVTPPPSPPGAAAPAPGAAENAAPPAPAPPPPVQ